MSQVQCAKGDCSKPAIGSNRVQWLRCKGCSAAWHAVCLPRGRGTTTAPQFKRRGSRKGTVQVCPSCQPEQFEANRYHRTRSFSMDQMFTTSFLEDWHSDTQPENDVERIEPGGCFLDTPSSPELYNITMLSARSKDSRRSQSMGSLLDVHDGSNTPNGDIARDGSGTEEEEDKTPDQSTADLTAHESQDQPGELRVDWSTSVSQSDDEPNHNQLSTSPPEGVYQRRKYNSMKSPSRRKASAPVVRRQSATAGTQTELKIGAMQPIPDYHPGLDRQRSFSVCGTIAALFGRSRFASGSGGLLSKSLDERSLRMAKERQESGGQGLMDRWRNGRKYSQWIWEKWDSAVNLMRQRGWVCVYVSRNTRRLRSARGRPCFKIEGGPKALSDERLAELRACWTSDVTLVRAYFGDCPLRLERDITGVLVSSYQWERKWFSCFRPGQRCGIGHRNEWLGLRAGADSASVHDMLAHLDQVCHGWLNEYRCDRERTQKHPLPDRYEN